MSIPAAKSFTKYSESTGESFSAESGCCLPTPSIATTRTGVSGGTSKPAMCAILVAGLAHALRIHRPVRRHQQFAQRLFLLRVAKKCLLRFQLREDAVAQRLFGHDGLLAGADRAVVERFACDNFTDGVVQVRRMLHQHRDVARPHAERRLAARIRRLDDAVAAGGEDYACALVTHQRVGGFERRGCRRSG